MAAAELAPILILLAAAVLAVVVCRFYALPPILGYLVAGLALGPHALGLIADNAQTHALAEVGVVFLMFSIGLEFNLPKLRVMRREVWFLMSTASRAIANPEAQWTPVWYSFAQAEAALTFEAERIALRWAEAARP